MTAWERVASRENKAPRRDDHTQSTHGLRAGVNGVAKPAQSTIWRHAAVPRVYRIETVCQAVPGFEGIGGTLCTLPSVRKRCKRRPPTSVRGDLFRSSTLERQSTRTQPVSLCEAVALPSDSPRSQTRPRPRPGVSTVRCPRSQRSSDPRRSLQSADGADSRASSTRPTRAQLASAMFGLRTWPTPIWRPIWPFAVGAGLTTYGIWKLQGAMAASCVGRCREGGAERAGPTTATTRTTRTRRSRTTERLVGRSRDVQCVRASRMLV